MERGAEVRPTWRLNSPLSEAHLVMSLFLFWSLIVTVRAKERPLRTVGRAMKGRELVGRRGRRSMEVGGEIDLPLRPFEGARGRGNGLVRPGTEPSHSLTGPLLRFRRSPSRCPATTSPLTLAYSRGPSLRSESSAGHRLGAASSDLSSADASGSPDPGLAAHIDDSVLATVASMSFSPGFQQPSAV